jgi:ParB family chromosome partitioning protein
MSRQIENIRVEFIETLPGRRPVNEEAVLRLMESIKRIGLRTPLSVRLVDGFKVDGDEVDGQPILVAGAHRLEAVRRLGWEHVECFVMADGDEANARRWEIAENLHRADLTTIERTELVAEWIKLAEDEVISSQVATKSKSARNPKGAGRNASGIRAAAKELGIDKDAAHRAIKIAALTPEAKATAIEVGLDDNQSALLQAAKAAPEEQPAILRTIAAVKEETKRTLKEKPAPAPMPDDEFPQWTSEHETAYASLIDTWDAAPEEARQAFLRYIPARYFGGMAA